MKAELTTKTTGNNEANGTHETSEKEEAREGRKIA
jgi:hypothetical protein